MAQNLTPLPSFTDVVEQRFLVEPLGGGKAPGSYLDRFPDEIYSKAPDSHLVRFLYALLGPSGVGDLHANYLQARLVFEDHGLDFTSLEDFYGNPFQFGRLFAESYESDPSGLLTQAEWDDIRAKDARYRSRAIDFFNGVRAGNTPLGMRLVARSGLGYDVEIIENYKAIFDFNSDDPIGLRNYGQTTALSEMVVVPRHETSTSEVQQITVDKAVGGSFRVQFGGQTTYPIFWPVVPSGLAAAAGTGTGTFSAGTYYWVITAVDATGETIRSNEVSRAVTGTSTVALTWNLATGATSYNVYRGTAAGAENVLVATTVGNTSTSYTDTGSAGTSQTPPTSNASSSALNGSAAALQAALASLSTIGTGNVKVTGGPSLVGSSVMIAPYQVLFTGALASQDVPPLQALNDLAAVDALSASAPTIVVETITNGIDSADELVHLPSVDQHSLQVAVDRLRPVGVIPTVHQGAGIRQTQTSVVTAASSEAIEVLRYVTGQSNVAWPENQTYQWIRKNSEREAPRGAFTIDRHYQGFHNVASVTASSLHVGRYSSEQCAAFPFLTTFTDDTLVYTADRSLADYAEPLSQTSTITTDNNTVGLVQGIYPAEYFGLQGVPEIRYKDEQFWSSVEAPTGGETLIIDLGVAQALNFVAFEVTSKPLDLLVEYDTLDYDGANFAWRAVTPEANLPYPDSIGYDSTFQNPWTYTELGFTDALGVQVFARYIRLTFSRRTTDGYLPFLGGPGYSVEVRNLRVGRRVA